MTLNIWIVGKIRTIFFSLNLKKNLFWLYNYSCSNFSPVAPLHLISPVPPAIHLFCLRPWVMPIHSMPSPFHVILNINLSILYLPFFYFLIPAPFLPFSPSPSQLISLQMIYDSIPVLLVCLVCFLDSVVDSFEFIAIFMFIV